MKKIYQHQQMNTGSNLHTLCAWMLVVLCNLPVWMYSQNSYTFTNCSATGSAGPTQAMINSTYSGTNGAVQVTVQGVQQWTVPVTSLFRIEAWGATAGNARTNIDGRGRKLSAEIFLTAGTVLNIVVGQKGLVTTQGGTNWKSGGGGASWVYSGTTPYLIAGGGGGAGQNSTSSDAPFNTNFHSGTAYHVTTPVQTNTNVGFGGPAGGILYSTYATGAGGAGWFSDGAESTTNRQGLYNNRGKCRTNNFLGGQASNYNADGGFGGGAAGVDNTGAGGGGGGYTGGPGGDGYVPSNWGSGGGGSSFWHANATNVTNLGVNTDHGKVILTELCNISLNASSNPICVGTTVTLTTNAVSNYSWSTGSSASSLVVTPSVNTTYSLAGTSSLNCSAWSVVTLTVSSGLPVLSIASSTNQTCLGKAVTFTASGGLTHTWTGGVSNGVPFTPTVTDTYTVTGQNGCGTSTAAITVTVAPLPVGIAASSTLVCQFGLTTLMAAGATDYTWMPGNITTPTAIVGPSVATIYTVTATDGTCSGTASITINTKPNPTITVVASASTICAGESVTITASGADTYTWTPPAITGNTGVVTPTTSSLYQVSGTNSVGCTTGGAQVVIVNPVPVISTASTATLVCVGGAATLAAMGNADTYLWSTGTPGYSTVINPTVSGTYTVVGTISSSGCNSSQVISISVFEPLLQVSPSTTICLGAAVTLTAGPGTVYVWSNGTTGFPAINVSPTVSTTYSVSAMTVSNNIVCPVSNTIHVAVNPNPTVAAVASRTAMCRFEKITVTAEGANTYSWSNNATGATLTFSSNLIMLHNLFVIGVDANGCSDTTSFQLRVNSCTGLEELSSASSGLQIYPNPNSGEFTISAASEASLLLMNELGQVVRSFQLSEQKEYKMNVKDLAGGIYFVTGTVNNKPVSHKIIVH